MEFRGSQGWPSGGCEALGGHAGAGLEDGHFPGATEPVCSSPQHEQTGRPCPGGRPQPRAHSTLFTGHLRQPGGETRPSQPLPPIASLAPPTGPVPTKRAPSPCREDPSCPPQEPAGQRTGDPRCPSTGAHGLFPAWPPERAGETETTPMHTQRGGANPGGSWASPGLLSPGQGG